MADGLGRPSDEVGDSRAGLGLEMMGTLRVAAVARRCNVLPEPNG
jgi:hypothetical protein